MASHGLESLSGIGPATAQALIAAGFTDRDSIAVATVDQLIAVPGFAEARASAVIAEARIVGGSAPADTTAVTKTAAEAVESDPDRPPEPGRKLRKKLRTRHVELKKRAKRARKKSKTASSKKKRTSWAAEADRLARKARKVKKRLSRLD